MTTISLRAYNRQVNDLIENGEAHLAIQHCQHILESYPKCVDTYRLLATAYLENSQFKEASEVFQRLLSAVPDDRLAHIGMSVIREHDGNLDEAIWHMERANELQPANRLLQDELRRMYGLRDGLEPPRIHLTSAALARMYYKGRLYNQAVAEINSILREQPERIDLQILQARTYKVLGKQEEACQICSRIIDILPYCLEANLMMKDCRKGAGDLEGDDIFAVRAAELDPYNAHTTQQQPIAEEIPDLFVTLNWMEIQPDSKPSHPGPAVEVPPEIERFDAQEEQLPDWIQDLENEITTHSDPGGPVDRSEINIEPDEDQTRPLSIPGDVGNPITDEDTKPVRVKGNPPPNFQELQKSGENQTDHDISISSNQDDRDIDQDIPGQNQVD